MDPLTSKPATIANPAADLHSGAEAPKHESNWFGDAGRDTWLSGLVILLMFPVMLALFWFPVKRAFTSVEVNYNEGWNTYRAAMVAKGIPLYGALPRQFAGGTAYPPLSFHVMGLLGNANTFTEVGRVISILSLLATGIFVGLIVKQAGGSQHTAVFSFLLYEIGIALLRADRIGMNDPQLLGEAISAAGLYFYVRNPDSRRLLWLSAMLFCVAGFTKHNLIAFPAAVGLDLLFRSRRSFFTWVGAMAVSGGLLTALTFAVDGRYFLLHLMGSGGRTYSYAAAWSQFHHFVEKFQPLLVIAIAWSILALRSRRVLALAFAITTGLAIYLSGGYGVDLNIFFNAFAVTVIACGLMISDIEFAFYSSRSALLNPSATMMCGLFFISVFIFAPGQLRRDRQLLRALPAEQAEFNTAMDFLKSRPGPAICESHLLCYDAGKPFEFEPFSVRYLLMTGKLREDDVLQLLKTHHFQTVEIALRSDEEDLSAPALLASLGSDQKDPEKERRFSPNFMTELLQDYQLSLRTKDMVIFCPK